MVIDVKGLFRLDHFEARPGDLLIEDPREVRDTDLYPHQEILLVLRHTTLTRLARDWEKSETYKVVVCWNFVEQRERNLFRDDFSAFYVSRFD